MYTVRYAEKHEYGYPCYVVVTPEGNDKRKFTAGVDADFEKRVLDLQLCNLSRKEAEAQAAQEFKTTNKYTS